MKTKLIRNLKKGDKFRISCESPVRRSAIVTVSHVQETIRGPFSGRRVWQVLGDYPWWWGFPVRGYSDSKMELIEQ